ncbi:hypothetical protein ASG50_14005 [Rhizobium sp. Leaf386]|nr:hypothetical protein ASG50_14005 [Rhizobium sp. Leaf386]
MKLLNECVKRGSKIGTIAGLSDSSLRKVLQEHGHRTAPLAEVLDCVRRLDQAGLEAQLGIRLVAMGSNAFAQEFVLPLLQEVGDLWAQGLLSTAAEHMLSASLRSLLGAAVRIGNPYTPRATALFATPEGDLHEFGLLSAAIAAQAQGIRTIYLGPQVPTEELAKAAKSTGARFIVLSSEVLEPQRLQNALEALRLYDQDYWIAVGGRSFGQIDCAKVERTIQFISIADFESWLALPRKH